MREKRMVRVLLVSSLCKRNRQWRRMRKRKGKRTRKKKRTRKRGRRRKQASGTLLFSLVVVVLVEVVKETVWMGYDR